MPSDVAVILGGMGALEFGLVLVVDELLSEWSFSKQGGSCTVSVNYSSMRSFYSVPT